VLHSFTFVVQLDLYYKSYCNIRLNYVFVKYHFWYHFWQTNAKESLEAAGYHLHSVLTITLLLDYWEKTGKVDKEKIRQTRAFLTIG
jgi:orotate phosphoribosyltransferase